MATPRDPDVVPEKVKEQPPAEDEALIDALKHVCALPIADVPTSPRTKINMAREERVIE